MAYSQFYIWNMTVRNAYSWNMLFMYFFLEYDPIPQFDSSGGGGPASL